ncbi:MAG: hypothetical protein KJN90_15200 [Gammaproteobacteria bacterium]|nr:hypothetical protein [Gammaproteobacteria bacterium]
MGLGKTPKANDLSATRQHSLQDSYLPKKRSNRPLLHYCLILGVFLFPSLHAAPPLTSDLSISSEGYFVLSWETESDLELVLQQSSNPTFTTDLEQWSVTGATQFTQSGLTNGDYFYRLIDDGGASNTVSVEVAHHSLNRAAFFFTLGAVLFGILISVLLLGRQRTQRTGDV